MATEEVASIVARHDVEIANLKGWQKKQNGTLTRVEEKVDALDEKVDSRFNQLLYWLLGVAIVIIGFLVKH
jgi:hypothetical protein